MPVGDEGWTLTTLHEHIAALLAEADRRSTVRFDAQEKAVNAALAAAEKAVAKAEVAAEKRFDAVNEFRAQLADQAATLMPRLEAEQRMAQNTEKIEAQGVITSAAIGTLSSRLDVIQGRSSGAVAGWGYVVAAITVVGILVAIAIAIGGTP